MPRFASTLIWWCTVEIGPARLLGKLLYLEHGNCLAGCLRHFGRRAWQRSRNEGFHFTHVEPDEVTQSTHVDIYCGPFRQLYFDHGMRAGRTTTSRFSFTTNCVKPKRID